MSSILDIAREVNVAASTVSRVMNGSAQISSETQERVHAAVRRLGYMPNGRDTRRKVERAWHLGVVHPPLMVVNGAVVQLCRDWIIGIKKAVHEAGGNIEIFTGTRAIDLDTMYMHSLDNEELHGVILLGAHHQTGYVEESIRRQLPGVLISDRSPNGNISSVYADMYSAGLLAMEHLLSLGHRRIALGNLPTGQLWSSDLRRRGAIDALAAHGLEPAVDKQASPEFDDLAYFDAAAGMLMKDKVTALFCSDFAAVRYIEALNRLGVNVPNDFSVVGCDNVGIKPENGLTLTSIDYDKVAMGRLAASTLMRLIRKSDEIQHMDASVPTHLVLQQTTAKAP